MKNKLPPIFNISILTIIIIIIITILSLLNILYIYTYNSNINLVKDIYENNYNPKIKTSILISGQIRNDFFPCLLSQKIFLYDPLNTDIFAVFSDDISNEMKQKIVNILKPKSILWVKDNQKLYQNRKRPKMFLMYEKIFLCNNLRKEYQKKNNIVYDVNIRIRPDLIVKNYIPNSVINNIQTNTIYSPYMNNMDLFMNMYSLGISDQLFIGDEYSTNIISDIFIYIKNDNPHISEVYLKKFLDKVNINISYIYYKFIISKLSSENKNIFYFLLYIINFLLS